MKKTSVHPILIDLMQAACTACDGVLFDQCGVGVCPQCGGSLSGYDVKKKQFAIIVEGSQKKAIQVRVKRYLCRDCGQICLADQPFYPGTRLGSPVVDLCVTLGASMPYSRVSAYLARAGIIVDRWSVRNYAKKICHPIPSVDMFGVRLPLSLLTMSSLATKVQGESRIDAKEILAACRFPFALNTTTDN